MAIKDLVNKFDKGTSKLSQYERKISGIVNNPLSAMKSAAFGSISDGTLGKALARPDALMSFDWEVELPVLTIEKTYSLGSEYVERCSVVLPDFGTRYRFLNGVNTPFPEVAKSYDNVTMTIYADVNNNALSYFNAWMNLTSPFPGTFGTPKPSKHLGGKVSGYKHDIILRAKDPYNEDVFVLQYIGAMLVSFAAVDDFSSDNNRMQYTATFAITSVQLNGCNVGTLTYKLHDAVSGTVNKFANLAKDAALGVGMNAAKSAWSVASKNATVQKITGLSSFFK